MIEKERKIPATLALADGTVFEGISVGAEGEAAGEVVFNTSMTGYQEILTDPSYAYQMLTFTYPHIGNVGVNSEDVESKKVQVAGVVVREFSEHHSNFRAGSSLSEYLKDNNVVGISGIDTRALVLHLRTHGAQMGIIASGEHDGSHLGAGQQGARQHATDELVDKACSLPSMAGLDLVTQVTTSSSYEWTQGTWQPGKGYTQHSRNDLLSRPLVVALDYGIKFNILRLLIDEGFRVVVVPGTTSAEEILKLHPQGIFLSNGPGDPAAVDYAIRCVKTLLGKQPIFGICLGHQILGLALGAPTYKLKFGHRGGNHPVRNEITEKVEITVQNHGFATDAQRLPLGLEVTHLNLNDFTIEGFEAKEARAFSVQYHPEASPGPQDAHYLFRKFRKMIMELS